MATKKNRKRSKADKASKANATKADTTAFGVKAEFVRKHPVDMRALDLQALAAKHGIKMSTNHIYTTRALMKKKANGTSGDSTPVLSVARRRLANEVVTNGSSRMQDQKAKLLRRLESSIMGLGILVAEEVLNRMKASLAAFDDDEEPASSAQPQVVSTKRRRSTPPPPMPSTTPSSDGSSNTAQSPAE